MCSDTAETKKSPPSTLKELVESSWAMFTTGIEKDTPFQTFILQGADDMLTVIVAPWQSENEKFMALMQVSMHINEINAKRYVLLSEVWESQVSREEGVMPMQASDRRSAVFALGVARDGEIYQLRASLDIAADGTRTMGLPELPGPETKISGLMTNLFAGAERLKNPEYMAMMSVGLHMVGSRKIDASDKDALDRALSEVTNGQAD